MYICIYIELSIIVEAHIFHLSFLNISSCLNYCRRAWNIDFWVLMVILVLGAMSMLGKPVEAFFFFFLLLLQIILIFLWFFFKKISRCLKYVPWLQCMIKLHSFTSFLCKWQYCSCSLILLDWCFHEQDVYGWVMAEGSVNWYKLETL